MRARLAFASFAAVIPLALAPVACGGGGQEGAKSPENPAPPPSASAAAPSAPEPVPSTTTTTTMTLPDGGDLQGAKLGSTTTTVVPTTAVDGGPGKDTGPHAPEPGRAAKDIQTIILAHRDEARACYDNGLKANPKMEGNLDIKWTIDPNGKVTDIAVDDAKSDIHDPATSQCIMDIIKKIGFSVSAKGFETRTHYPFNFHPKTKR